MQTVILNKVGFLPAMQKSAVFRGIDAGSEFQVVNVHNDTSGYTGIVGAERYDRNTGETVCCGDFSNFTAEGCYYITVSGERSHNFKISDNVYNDFITDAVRMMYMQRCGMELGEKYAGELWRRNRHKKQHFLLDLIRKILGFLSVKSEVLVVFENWSFIRRIMA